MNNPDRTPSNTQPAGKAGPSRAFHFVLAAGLLIRIGVFLILTPQNNDAHFDVIRYIHRFGMLPDSSAFNQSYHPPLYYALASLFMFVGGIKVVQSLSLLLSCATLWVMARLLKRLPWIERRFQPWLLALPALHPQFVQYTLFVSNDTLAIFLGALIFHQAWRCLERPALKRQALLALGLGLGLATKYTFLAFIPPVAILILMLNSRLGLGRAAQALRLCGLMLLALAPGCIKPLQNVRDGLPPLVSNLDFDPAWAESQRPVWIGPASMFDANLVKLIRRPVISAETAHAWPLILYGSFWYSYIPESSFRSAMSGQRWLGGWIYVFALPITLLIVAGAVGCVFRVNPQSAIRNPQSTAGGDARAPGAFLGFALMLLALNLLLIEYAGWKYNVWSVFQARLFFPCYFAVLLCLHEGLRLIARWRPALAFVKASFVALGVSYLIFYGLETRLAIVKPVSPYSTFFPVEVFDMKAGLKAPAR